MGGTDTSGVSGAVLTGGAGRRMGRPKALVEVDGRAMVLRVADALAAGGCPVVRLVGGDRRLADVTGLDMIDDLWPGEGPLGGVIAALEAVRGDVLVAACDLPDLDAATVAAVIAGGAGTVDVAVAVTTRLQPALARWNRAAQAPLAAAFRCGERSLHGALAPLRVERVAVSPAAMRNVNRPEDVGAPAEEPSDRAHRR